MPARRQPPPPLFTAPGETIFVYDRPTGSWLISTWDGSEARVPRRDLEAFIRVYRSLVKRGDGGGAE